MTTFIPKGQTDLVVEGAERFPIVEEAITATEEEAAAPMEEFKVEPMPSSFDRSSEPPFGPDPEITLPVVWQENLANGLKLYGIENHELPLIQFTMTLKGGQLLDDINKIRFILVARILNVPVKNIKLLLDLFSEKPNNSLYQGEELAQYLDSIHTQATTVVKDLVVFSEQRTSLLQKQKH